MNTTRIAIVTLLALVLTLALVSFASAADCGDTAGPGGSNVPCSCGDTVVTNTTLKSLSADPVNGDPVVAVNETQSCPPGDGLVIVNPVFARLTLNLGDHQIRGSGTGVGIRIVGENVRVTVKNGRVKGFETGVLTEHTARNLVIQQIIASENVDGINVSGVDSELNTNIAQDNTGVGIRFVGDDSEILFNRSRRSAGNGIEIIGDRNEMHTNTVNNSEGHGILVTGHANWLDHNLSENNRLDGIAIIGDGDGDPGKVELSKNRALKNKNNGISLTGNNHNLDNNDGSTNSGTGIAVAGTGNELSSNKANKNKKDGIVVTGGGNVDDGGNFGKRNGGIDCQIDGIICAIP